MGRIIFTALLLTISTSSDAQWKKIANLEGNVIVGSPEGATVSAIYFLNLPGPIRIGFAGANGEMWKTTDGGTHWDSCWSLDGYLWGEMAVSDITFKDSLTGWFSFISVSDSFPACYRTTDGGNSWNPINVPYEYPGGLALQYFPEGNRLFIELDSGIYLSTDLGDNWKLFSDSLWCEMGFFSDSLGITFGNLNDSTFRIFQTTDVGLTWTFLDTIPFTGPPLVIPGTSICFTADPGRIIIRSSDDYGKTWHVVKDFGPVQDSHFNQIAPYGSGDIEGDLSRLYIQTDSGMFVSTDEGVTWNYDKGPKMLNNGAGNPSFYCGKGVTIAGWSDARTGDGEGYGLWEEIWPTSGVSGNDSNIISNASAYPNPTGTGTVISFGISKEAYVKIELYDLLGHPVQPGGRAGGADLREGLFEPGNKAVPISLEGLPSGTYFARIQTAYGEVQSVKIVKE